jgi:hypothetical protein
VVGRYREVATSREVRYVEEKGEGCAASAHRRNHTMWPDRVSSPSTAALVSRAS